MQCSGSTNSSFDSLSIWLVLPLTWYSNASEGARFCSAPPRPSMLVHGPHLQWPSAWCTRPFPCSAGPPMRAVGAGWPQCPVPQVRLFEMPCWAALLMLLCSQHSVDSKVLAPSHDLINSPGMPVLSPCVAAFAMGSSMHRIWRGACVNCLQGHG